MVQKKSRSFRKLGRIALGVLLLALVLVLLAPTLLSGYVGGVIEREVGARVHGTVSVGEVSLGWSGPQKVSALAIDGGKDIGSMRMDAEIAQGLWSLATGDSVALRLQGTLATAVDADGGVALARIVKPGPAPVQGEVAQDGTSQAAAEGSGAGAGTLLGGRRLSIELAGIDLRATRQDAVLYAIEGLSGALALSEDAGGTLSAKGDLDAKTRVGARNGAFEASFDAKVPRSGGRFDPSRIEGVLDVDATDLPLPGPAEALAERLELAIDASPERTTVAIDAVLRAAGSEASTVVAEIEVGPVLDSTGTFVLDPASLRAKVDAKSVPLAVFQPYMPELASGVSIDLVEDVGDVADVSIVKDGGAGAVSSKASSTASSTVSSKASSKASARFDARRLRVSFEGDVVADGSGKPAGVANGVLAASFSMRPELLRALGVETDTPLAATASATKVAWSRVAAIVPDGGSAAGGGPLRAVGGQFDVRLARAFDWNGSSTGPFAAVPVRVEIAGVTVDKPVGEDEARMQGVVEARFGDAGTLKSDFSGRVDVAKRAVSGGAFDALVGLDPKLVERLSNGAVRVGTQTASLRVAATGIEVQREHAPLGALHVELGGALAISGGDATAMMNDLAADVALPGAARPGTLTLSAKIDGAQARVQQSFDRIPKDFSDPASLGLSGSIELAGLDPSVISRMAPAAADRIGVLGRGPMRLSLRNRTDAGVLGADFDVTAAALAARGAARIAKDSIALRDIVCDGTLTREAVASLGLGDGVELDPGARYALRLPAFAIGRGDEGWAPSGDIAGTATVQGLVVRRAPGIKAPLAIARIATEARYVLREERAAAKGTFALGASGGDGSVAFDLGWTKPAHGGAAGGTAETAETAEMKVFAGLEGTLEATALDFARLEAPLGLEAGRVSDVLGGPGTLRVAFTERDVATAAISAGFPRFRSQIDATVPATDTGRVANAKGSLHAEIAPDVFARMAGIGQDAKRRVASTVTLDLAIASLALPLDGAWKPGLAGAAIDASGTISPVSIEVTDERGAKSTVSTGALAVTAFATRASEEITLKVATPKPANATSADARGSLDADAKLRGLFAETQPGTAATPLGVDAVVAARGFPSATFDALGATHGAIGLYLGDSIDADIDAKVVGVGTPAARGTVKASLASPNARVDVPEVAIADGFARVSASKPMTATLALSKPVREQLLAPLHQIFADIVSGAPARFTLASLAWPLDGDRRRFDAEFTLETGEVKLVNSGLLSWILMAAQAGRSDGFEAFIEPLRGRIAKGRLTYRDFAMRAGKTMPATGTAGWKNSLVFSGDIDLASIPMRAIAITTGVPLSDAGNWSSDARRLFESIGAVSPELLKSLVVGVKLSGPLFDAQGRPAKLEESLELPDIGEAIRRNPGGAIEAVGGILDLFKKKDEKKDEKKGETKSGKNEGKTGEKAGGKKQEPKSPPSKDGSGGGTSPDGAPQPPAGSPSGSGADAPTRR